MVNVDNVSRRFGNFMALDGVSLEVKPGEVFGLLGPNGSGKTTLIRILTGVLPMSGGHAHVGGLDVGRQPEQVKSIIGYATQEASVYRDLTVKENLEFRARLYMTPGGVKYAVEQTLERFGLQEYALKLAGSLSGGWRQRLALAQAVIHEPKVVFLDEPTTGLDPVSRRTIWDLIHQEAARGAVVFVTTHYMDEAERCHRLAMLYGGKIIAQGTPHQLQDVALQSTRVAFSQTDLPLEQIRAMPGVLESWPSGNGVRLILENNGKSPNLPLQTVYPNLEDVFIVLTKHSHNSSPSPAGRGEGVRE